MPSRAPCGVPLPAALLILLAVLLSAPGCLVLGLERFYDDANITFDERLLGSWKDVEDNLTVTVERSEWRSYRVTYAHATDSGVLTGYLFDRHGTLCLDLMPQRGQDPGPLLVIGHALARVSITAAQATVAPLSFDWFSAGIANKNLPTGMTAVKSERDQMLITMAGAALRDWLDSRPAPDPAFGPPAVFTRQ